MGFYSRSLEKVKQMPAYYLTLAGTVRFLIGLGVGVLLATWLPIWSGWIFVGGGLLIAIPIAIAFFRK